MHTVVAYDVADNQRRQRIVRALEDVGDRVQYSVFEAVLSAEQLAHLREQLAQLIDPNQDSVRFYPLCQGCEGRIGCLGVRTVVGGEDAFIV